MSRSKIQSVLEFPLPSISKQLKSFLGLVNYFRDFVRSRSNIVKPLHALLTKNQRKFVGQKKQNQLLSRLKRK